jgi:hypothetical protein
MPIDHRRRFDQHHGVEDLRPDPVKPNPEQPVGGEEPRLAGTLPAQDGHLMSQGDEFKFQRGAAAHPEREQMGYWGSPDRRAGRMGGCASG